MTKREVFSILHMVASFYDQFEVSQEKLEYWYKALKESSFGDCEQRVLRHASISPYPPKVCDFAIQIAGAGRAIPNSEETIGILRQTEKPASDEVVQFYLAKIRGILGIERGK